MTIDLAKERVRRFWREPHDTPADPLGVQARMALFVMWCAVGAVIGVAALAAGAVAIIRHLP